MKPNKLLQKSLLCQVILSISPKDKRRYDGAWKREYLKRFLFGEIRTKYFYGGNRLLTSLGKWERLPDWCGIGKAECFLSRNMEWRKEWKSLRLHRYWLKAPFERLLSRTDGYFAFLFCVVSLCNHLTFYVCYHDVPYLGKRSNASFKFFVILCSNGYRSFCAASQFARSVSANISTYVKINRERRSIVSQIIYS